ncbi:uncharacterized protein LOC144077130 isoform X2 [Stigmatopora argus]
MKLTMLLPLLWVLMHFGCDGRTLTRCELRERLRERITLSENTKNLTEDVLTMLVCHMEKISNLDTNAVRICGQRAAPVALPLALSNETQEADPKDLLTDVTVAPTDPEVTSEPEETEEEDEEEEEEILSKVEEACGNIYDEEGEYLYWDQNNEQVENWKRVMEMLNQEENAFDEELLVIADAKMSADGSDSEVEWSLGYHGLLGLPDSFFCQSSARYSENVCGTKCSAFRDDDIKDDMDCFIDSLYWLYVLRTVGVQCYQKPTEFFSKCG